MGLGSAWDRGLGKKDQEYYVFYPPKRILSKGDNTYFTDEFGPGAMVGYTGFYAKNVTGMHINVNTGHDDILPEYEDDVAGSAVVTRTDGHKVFKSGYDEFLTWVDINEMHKVGQFTTSAMSDTIFRQQNDFPTIKDDFTGTKKILAPQP